MFIALSNFALASLLLFSIFAAAGAKEEAASALWFFPGQRRLVGTGAVKTAEGRRVRMGAGWAASAGAGGAATEKRGVENPGIKNRGTKSGSRTRATIEVARVASAETVAKISALLVAPLLEVNAGEAAEAAMLGE